MGVFSMTLPFRSFLSSHSAGEERECQRSMLIQNQTALLAKMLGQETISGSVLLLRP